MSSIKIAIMTCDRCKKVEEIRKDHQRYSWGSISAFALEINGPFRIGEPPSGTSLAKPRDICAACVQELKRWWDKS